MPQQGLQPRRLEFARQGGGCGRKLQRFQAVQDEQAALPGHLVRQCLPLFPGKSGGGDGYVEPLQRRIEKNVFRRLPRVAATLAEEAPAEHAFSSPPAIKPQLVEPAGHQGRLPRTAGGDELQHMGLAAVGPGGIQGSPLDFPAKENRGPRGEMLEIDLGHLGVRREGAVNRKHLLNQDRFLLERHQHAGLELVRIVEGGPHPLRAQAGLEPIQCLK